MSMPNISIEENLPCDMSTEREGTRRTHEIIQNEKKTTFFRFIFILCLHFFSPIHNTERAHRAMAVSIIRITC